MRILILTLVLMVSGVPQALAAGCRCGDSYIDCNKTCHIGGEEEEEKKGDIGPLVGILAGIFVIWGLAGLIGGLANRPTPRGVPDTVYTEENPPPVGGWISETSGGVSLGLSW